MEILKRLCCEIKLQDFISFTMLQPVCRRSLSPFQAPDQSPSIHSSPTTNRTPTANVSYFLCFTREGQEIVFTKATLLLFFTVNKSNSRFQSKLLKMTQAILLFADVNEDEWEDVDDSASLDSVEDETEEEAAQQDVDMVRTLVMH